MIVPSPSKRPSPAPAAPASGGTQPKAVALHIEYGTPDNFRWQMAFNAFSLEKVSNGVLIRVAYVVGSGAAEIVPILMSAEGVEQFVESATKYIEELGDTPPYEGGALPNVRSFSPLFSNHLRASRSGSSAEFGFYTVPLREMIEISRSQVATNTKIKCVQVALLHSDVKIHQQLVVALAALHK